MTSEANTVLIVILTLFVFAVVVLMSNEYGLAKTCGEIEYRDQATKLLIAINIYV